LGCSGTTTSGKDISGPLYARRTNSNVLDTLSVGQRSFAVRAAVRLEPAHAEALVIALR
jgi:hypothetical protein